MNAFREACQRDGSENAMQVFRDSEVCVDWNMFRDAFHVVIQWRNTNIWEANFNVSERSLYDSEERKLDSLKEQIRSKFGTLNMASQIHFVQLSRHFPGSIKEVEVAYNLEKAQKEIAVKFKNGHVAHGLEAEVESDLFLARCAMLYDLPHL